MLEIRVQPGASKTEIVALTADGSIKVRLKALPVKGRANRELMILLAATFGIPSASLKMVSGAKSRQKSILVKGLAKSKATELLKHSLRPAAKSD